MKRVPLFLLFLQATRGFTEPLVSRGGPETIVPPPAPPLLHVSGTESRVRAAATVYSIGDPTPEEQLYLELINRARANPPAEGIRLATTTDPVILGDYQVTGVDLNLMQGQFAALSSAQPLAMNAKLTTAARAHSLDMFNNVFQEHNGSDGASPFDRLTAVGYFGTAGENVYSNAKGVAHGHAAFEVDWGGPASNGGMQSPPGHREAIHNPIFREVGIGVVNGANQMPGKIPLDHVGPQLVTQDFGVQQNSTPMITGVAYYDLNGNNFYDVGEGIGEVRVAVASGNSEGITARSGGYAVPVPGNGTYTVTFTGTGFTPFSKNVTVVGSKSQKLDFMPSYAPPVVTGPSAPAVGRQNSFSISTVAGASAYQWRSYQRVVAAAEGAENDSARVTITQTGTYDVIEGIVVKSGSYAFHLITPSEAARSQYVTLSPTYLISANSALSFQSKLGFGLPAQHARVQISTDGGATWITIDNQDGDIDHPDQTWKLRTISLSAYAGQALRVRFAYEFFNGRYVSSNDLNVGWLFDDIQFTGTEEIVNERVADAAGTTFQFNPDQIADFSLQARARTGHDFLNWGPAFAVRSAVATAAPELRLSVTSAGNQLQIDADLISGATPAQLKVEGRSTLGDSWQVEAAPIQNLSPTRFRVTLTPASGVKTRFYRLRAD